MSLENTWQDIRDHSFIQNHSRPFIFTASFLQFISLILYRVQVREHLTSDQRPFLHPESLQILYIPSSMTVLLLFSSPHSFSTGFRSEHWNGRSRSLVLCSVNHLCVVFEVCVWIIVWLEDPNMAHYKISNRVSHLLIFICWYFIESTMPCV